MQTFFDKDEAFLQAPTHLKHLIDASPGLRNGFFALGDDPTDDQTPGVVMLQLEPGHILERHAHPCFRFEVVVAGTLYAGDKVLGPGDVMVALPGQHYGPHTAGPEGATTCEVFSSFTSSFQPIFEGPDGSARQYDFLAGDIPAEDVWEHNRKNAPAAPEQGR